MKPSEKQDASEARSPQAGPMAQPGLQPGFDSIPPHSPFEAGGTALGGLRAPLYAAHLQGMAEWTGMPGCFLVLVSVQVLVCTFSWSAPQLLSPCSFAPGLLMQPELSRVYLGVCQVRNPSACPAPESKFSKASSQSASEGQCKSGQFSSL